VVPGRQRPAATSTTDHRRLPDKLPPRWRIPNQEPMHRFRGCSRCLRCTKSTGTAVEVRGCLMAAATVCLVRALTLAFLETGGCSIGPVGRPVGCRFGRRAWNRVFQVKAALSTAVHRVRLGPLWTPVMTHVSARLHPLWRHPRFVYGCR
jgi:hypothetical protein